MQIFILPKKKLTWRFYTIAEALSITKQVEFISKKKSAKTALDKNIEAFVVYVTSLSLSLMSIYLAKKAQIVLLLARKIKILAKYLDFSDVFLEEKPLVLQKLTKLNQHTIELQDSKQSLYGPIYSFRLVELKTLKIYIKTNLANNFIWPSK